MKRLYLYLGVLVLVLGAGLASRAVFGPETPATQPTGVARVGGPFTLTDHTGKTVTDADYRGKYMLMFFGYTYCPDVCPTTLQTVSDAMNILGADADKVQPIFVSVDSGRDTPDVMKLYVDAFGGRIEGLSGTPDQIKSIAKAYGVYYAKVKDPSGDPNSYSMDHSAIVYLMGPDGAFITHFPYGVTAAEMAAKIKSVMN